MIVTTRVDVTIIVGCSALQLGRPWNQMDVNRWGTRRIAKLMQIAPRTRVCGNYNYSSWGL